METSHFKLTPKPPYSFDLTAGYLAYFQGHYGADRLEDGVFSRLLDIDGKLALLRVSSAGTVDAPLLELSVAGDGLDEAEVSECRRQAEWMLGIDQDLSSFYAMARDDEQLGPVVELMCKRAIVVADGDEDRIVVRPTAVLGQSFDHRAIDGAYSAAFLARVGAIIEGRDWNAEFA